MNRHGAFGYSWIGLLIFAAIIYFVIRNPEQAAGMVRTMLGLIVAAIEALFTFASSLAK